MMSFLLGCGRLRGSRILGGTLLLIALAGWTSGQTVLSHLTRSTRFPTTAARRSVPVERQARTGSFETRKFRLVTLRLRPGQDLRQGIEELVKARNIRAGFILTAVGSLQSARIRLADQSESSAFAGKFEIVSLVGTMGLDGVHLHISLADSSGKTIGGHLVEGCLIYTTAEIVIGDAQGLTFARESDAQTGYKELKIRRNGRQ